MMNKELLDQYGHCWKMFHEMVADFDDGSWLSAGCSYIKPARIAYHILLGVKYYIQDQSDYVFDSGRKAENDWETLPEALLPGRGDILAMMHAYKGKADDWLSRMDWAKEQAQFEWTGRTELSVALFLLRHMEYHIGELNLMLHQSKGGAARDNWIGAFAKIEI
jgi:hypothetical protein